jgi:hypothetical protein
MIYGSDEARALALRTLGGDGKLKTSSGNLLPLNTFGLDNGTGGSVDPTKFYVAGDLRANDEIGLTAVHTLMMREHNRLAEQIAIVNPSWDDEAIYQRARKLVGAEIQVITFNEFLPALLGDAAPSITGTYDANSSAAILSEFSTALLWSTTSATFSSAKRRPDLSWPLCVVDGWTEKAEPRRLLLTWFWHGQGEPGAGSHPAAVLSCVVYDFALPGPIFCRVQLRSSLPFHLLRRPSGAS